jgi:phage FluMu protein Com
MESRFHFPMSMTIRCYQCGKVYDAVLTSEEPHELPCPDCGKVEVYDLASMVKKVEKIIRKRTRGL